MKYLTGLVLLIFVSSCQREVEGDLTDDVINDNIYIDRIVEVDTTYPSGLDTTYKDQLYYDAQKRLIRVVETYFDAGTHTVNSTLILDRFYSGNDSVPFKIAVEEAYSTGEIYKDTGFLYYNNNNRIIKDSVVSYDTGIPLHKKVELFFDEGGGKYLVTRTTNNYITGSFMFADSVRLTRTFSSGNLVSSSDSTFSAMGGPLQSVFRYTLSHDNKKNPFIKLALPYLALQMFGSIGMGENLPQFSSRNNHTSYTLFSWAGGSPNTNSGEVRYVYDNNDYPVLIRYTSTSSPNPQKLFIYYRTL